MSFSLSLSASGALKGSMIVVNAAFLLGDSCSVNSFLAVGGDLRGDSSALWMKLRPTALFIKLFESLLKETAGEYFMAAFEGDTFLGEPEGVYISSGFFTGDCKTMNGFCLNGSDIFTDELP